MLYVILVIFSSSHIFIKRQKNWKPQVETFFSLITIFLLEVNIIQRNSSVPETSLPTSFSNNNSSILMCDPVRNSISESIYSVHKSWGRWLTQNRIYWCSHDIIFLIFNDLFNNISLSILFMLPLMEGRDVESLIASLEDLNFP